MLDYSKLQNGSDIRGVALAGDEEVNLGREEAARLLRPLLNRDTVRRLPIVQAVIPEKNGEKQAF